jgi:DNA-binding NtrC family response regulator
MTTTDLDALLDEAGAPPKSGSLGPLSAERPLVLVVDDDEHMRRSIEMLLQTRYRLILCESASDGVQAFSGDVCAVILDVKMPGRDGFWACDEIRKIQSDVPIIFYSGYQDLKDPFEVINQHRPFSYLAKDGNGSSLLDAVELATRLYHATIRSRRLIDRLRQRRSGGP